MCERVREDGRERGRRGGSGDDDVAGKTFGKFILRE